MMTQKSRNGRKDAMKQTKRILSIRFDRIGDGDPDTSYLEQEGFEDRLEQYRNNQFSFIGIRASAEIHVPYMSEGRGGRTYFMNQTIKSAGLWGIEDDSDESYLEEVEQEELSQLREQLYALGFSKRAIASAVAQM